MAVRQMAYQVSATVQYKTGSSGIQGYKNVIKMARAPLRTQNEAQAKDALPSFLGFSPISQ